MLYLLLWELMVFIYFLKFLFIDERERNIGLLSHLFMHSLVALYVPWPGMNVQFLCIGMALQSTELPSQGGIYVFVLTYFSQLAIFCRAILIQFKSANSWNFRPRNNIKECLVQILQFINEYTMDKKYNDLYAVIQQKSNKIRSSNW